MKTFKEQLKQGLGLILAWLLMVNLAIGLTILTLKESVPTLWRLIK